MVSILQRWRIVAKLRRSVTGSVHFRGGYGRSTVFLSLFQTMGQDLPPGCSDQSRTGMNLENLRRRDPNSRKLLGPLFGQVAVATVRNVLYNSVASLQNMDKLLASKVAQLRERKEQLQLSKNEDTRHQQDEQLEEHEKVDASYMLQNEELKHLKDE